MTSVMSCRTCRFCVRIAKQKARFLLCSRRRRRRSRRERAKDHVFSRTILQKLQEEQGMKFLQINTRSPLRLVLALCLLVSLLAACGQSVQVRPKGQAVVGVGVGR